MPEQKWKRSKIVVDKEFQFRYLMTWVLLTTSLLAGVVLASVSVFVLYQGDRTMFIWVNAACASVITALSMYYIIVHSHRIAGPAFRLKRVMGDMAAGRRGFRVKLRRKDYLKDLADSLNALLEKTEEREAKIHALALEVGEWATHGQDAAILREAAARVSRELSDLCPAVEKVHVDGAEKKA
jgi:methyl-accepting chemotaxis protein